MPRRSAKARARQASYRKQMNTEIKEELEKPEVIIISDDKNESKKEFKSPHVIVVDDDDNENNDLRIVYINHVSGHFNQGDFQFSEESRGR